MDARIVRNCRGRVLLNLSDRFVEAPLVVELDGSRHGKALVLRIRGSFRQNLRGFLEPALRLEARCLRRKCGLVPGRHLKDAIKDRPRLVETTDSSGMSRQESKGCRCCADPVVRPPDNVFAQRQTARAVAPDEPSAQARKHCSANA